MSFLLNIDSQCYGLKHVGSNLMIGEVPVLIKKDVLHIVGNKFPLTNGLIELLTKREPQGFNDKDLLNYKNILILTNAHMRKYRNVHRINSNKSWKYQNIISKLFPPKRKRKFSCSLQRYIPADDERRMECDEDTDDENLVNVNSSWKYRNIPLDDIVEEDECRLERGENIDPNTIVDMIRINKRLGLDCSVYINILRDKGIIK